MGQHSARTVAAGRGTGAAQRAGRPAVRRKRRERAGNITEIGHDDIQKKYHEFTTILRQHNVSGRENAFDKLVNLFLAKIVDEIRNSDKLQFYWGGTTI